LPPTNRSALFVISALILWAGVGWYNSDSRQIGRQLDELRSQVSKRSGETQLESLSKANSIGSMFAENFEVRADQLNISTRDKRTAVGAVMRYRSRSRSINMDISKHHLFVDSKIRRATSNLTVAFNHRLGALERRESYHLEINWVDESDGWKIDYVNLVEIQNPSESGRQP